MTKRDFISVTIYAIDDNEDFHSCTFTEYITTQEAHNKHIEASVAYVASVKKYRIIQIEIEEATDEEILEYLADE